MDAGGSWEAWPALLGSSKVVSGEKGAVCEGEVALREKMRCMERWRRMRVVNRRVTRHVEAKGERWRWAKRLFAVPILGLFPFWGG
jgi:hypothetical protein